MALTVGGFAPPRTGTLRGKGGNRGRRDNGVSPPPPSVALAAANAAATLLARRKHAPRRSSGAMPAADPRAACGRLPGCRRSLLAACLVALMYLLQTSGMATTGYDIQRLQTERDDWQLRNEQLQLELAKRQLADVDRIRGHRAAGHGAGRTDGADVREGLALSEPMADRSPIDAGLDAKTRHRPTPQHQRRSGRQQPPRRGAGAGFGRAPHNSRRRRRRARFGWR